MTVNGAVPVAIVDINILALIIFAPVILPPVPLDTMLPTVTLPVKTPATAPILPILALPVTERLANVPVLVMFGCAAVVSVPVK